MRRRGLALIASAVVVVLGAGFLTTTMTQDLEQGSTWWHEPDARVTAATHASAPMIELGYARQPGRRVTVGFSIHNPGPWPATITGIGDESDVFRIARLTMISSAGDAGAAYGPDAAAPFGTTTVAAGAELAVFATIILPDGPMAPGSAVYFDNVAVTYQVVGVPRHQWVPMGFSVSVHSDWDEVAVS
jgi:hypothetical protein